MSNLRNCTGCQGQGKKANLKGQMAVCLICNGSRKEGLSEKHWNDTRYNQNTFWKSFSMSNNELAGWAFHKRDMRRRVKFPIKMVTMDDFCEVMKDRAMDEFIDGRNRYLAHKEQIRKEKEDLMIPPWEK